MIKIPDKLLDASYWFPVQLYYLKPATSNF